jgi:hypothetical protein
MAQSKKTATARCHSSAAELIEHCNHFLLHFAPDLRLTEFSLATPAQAMKSTELLKDLGDRISRKQETCAALERACLACSIQEMETEEEKPPQ